MVTFVLALSMVTFVAASEGEPQGGCPDNFQLQMVMDHPHEGHHHHVGNDQDLNGDGWICGKHVSANGNVHVHIDNNIPLP